MATAVELNPQIVTMLQSKYSVDVSTLAFSSNGRILVSSGLNEIYIWDMKTREYRTLSLVHHVYFSAKGAPGIRSAALGPDDRTLVTTGGAGVLLWDIRTGAQLARLEYKTQSLPPPDATQHQQVIFSQDGKLVASDPCAQSTSSTCPTTQIFVWNAISKQRIGLPLVVPGEVNSIAFSPDGKMLASGSNIGVQLWNVATGQPVGSLLLDKAGVQSVTFSPDGRTLASGDGDATVKLWDVASAQLFGTLVGGHKDSITSVVFSPDGKTLASGSFDKTVRLWDVPHRAILSSVLTNDAEVQSLAFSPDGKTLASGSQSGTIVLWNIDATGTFNQSFTDKSGLQSVVYSPDGKILIVGSVDGQIFLRDVKTMALITTLSTANYPALQANGDFRGGPLSIRSLALSADGQTLASGRLDGTIILWDMKTRKSLAHFRHPSLLEKITLSSNGQILAASGDGDTLMLWNVTTRTVIRSLSSHSKYGWNPVALSPNGKLLAVDGCGKDSDPDKCDQRQILLWDVATGKLVGQPLSGHRDNVADIAFSPDGHILASSSYDGIILWDITVKKPVGQIVSAAESYSTDYYNTIMFSSNGKILLSFSEGSGVFGLWDVVPHKPFTHAISVGYGDMQGAAFSPNAQQIASVGFFGVTLWDISIESWQARACSIANRNLTEDEWKQFIGDDPYTKLCSALPVHWSVTDELLKQAQTAAQAGHTRDAALAYTQATQAAVQSHDTDFSNSVCWEGSLDRFAQEVLPACEHTVTLAQNDGDYRDSRGLARALTGDKSGAIDDFQFFVRWAIEHYVNAVNVDANIQASYKQYVNERNTWIQALQAGQNPFDTKILKALRDEQNLAP